MQKKPKVLFSVISYETFSKIDELAKELNLLKKILINHKNKFTFQIIIFDDGSSLETKQKLKKYFNENELLLYKKNLGYGGNVKRTFEYATKFNFDFIAIFPADMQRKVDDLVNMTNKLIFNHCDVIVGKKNLNDINGKYPLNRKFGNILISKMTKLLWNDKTSDPLSGFKVYKTDVCKELVWLCQNRYGFDIDFSFWSSLKKLKVIDLNASVSYENHLTKIKSTNKQGLFLIFRIIILGVVLKPTLFLLKKSFSGK